VLKPQGRRGEVLAELHTDFPERFAERRRLWAMSPDGSRRELQLEEHWFHKGGVVLKFAGVDNISAAEPLSGLELQVPLEQRSQLESGAAYVSELTGCDIWDGERFLGRVSDVQFGAGEAPLLMVTLPVCAARPMGSGGKTTELLVPFAEEFVTKLDLEGRRIDMQLPAGLLDVDAPLSEEEKRRQKPELKRRKPRRAND
jgi:16S rRNA processing protein RimM